MQNKIIFWRDWNLSRVRFRKNSGLFTLLCKSALTSLGRVPWPRQWSCAPYVSYRYTPGKFVFYTSKFSPNYWYNQISYGNLSSNIIATIICFKRNHFLDRFTCLHTKNLGRKRDTFSVYVTTRPSLGWAKCEIPWYQTSQTKVISQ